MDRGQRLGRGRGGATLGGFGAFLQATGAAPKRLGLALGQPLGVALLGRAADTRLAGVLRAAATAALLGGELLDGLGRLLRDSGRRNGDLVGGLLVGGLRLGCLSVRLRRPPG